MLLSQTISRLLFDPIIRQNSQYVKKELPSVCTGGNHFNVMHTCPLLVAFNPVVMHTCPLLVASNPVVMHTCPLLVASNPVVYLQVLYLPSASPPEGRVEDQIGKLKVSEWSSVLKCYDVFLATKTKNRLTSKDTTTARHQESATSGLAVVSQTGTAISPVSIVSSDSDLSGCEGSSPVHQTKPVAMTTASRFTAASSTNKKSSHREKMPLKGSHPVSRHDEESDHDSLVVRKRERTSQKRCFVDLSDSDDDFFKCEQEPCPPKRSISDVIVGRGKKPAVRFIDSD